MQLRYLFYCIIIFLIAFSCRKEPNFITDSSAQLEFSTDTLTFDTVFTTVGSATRILKLFNPHSQPIRISKIHIPNGSQSRFIINVDGIPTSSIEDVEIAANDSLYIFGEVTVDPDQDISVSPFVINDEILIETNGNQQRVVLEAWGQNANYIPNRYANGGVALLSCNLGDVTWDDPKPYVIYGVLVVDSCTLNIPAGTNIYVHGGIARAEDDAGQISFYNDGIIFFQPRGTLNATGTFDNPVVIQGDRLEEFFDDESGQWAGIRLSEGSSNHRMEYTTIKNSIIGVRVDSAADLTIKNSQIYNTTGSGLIGLHADIEAENCLFYNNGGNAVQIEYGGNYDFKYCTLASYGVDAAALKFSNVLCLDPFCTEFRFNQLNIDFQNSIIFGSRKDELDPFDIAGDQAPNLFNYNFENCIVKMEEVLEEELYMNFFDFCDPCINAPSDAVLFMDPNEDNYYLDTLSIAEEQAIPLPNIFIDLEDNMRDGSSPDIGCFEYQY